MRTFAGITALALCCNLALAQKLTLKDLPPDVQKAIQLEFERR